MKRALLITLLLSIPLFAQGGSIVKWEDLAECLPKIQKIEDLSRGDVTGEFDQIPYTNVTYHDNPDVMQRDKEVSVNIEDFGNQPDLLSDALTEAPDISKPVLIKGKYKGVKIVEIYDSVVDYCKYRIIVADRFLISLDSTLDGDRTKEMEILIDNFDYAGLEKLK